MHPEASCCTLIWAITASRLAIRASDWASGVARCPSMNFSLLPSAVASPSQTTEDCCAPGAAFEVAASAKAPPPATAAALTSSASFFFVPRVLLRDMNGSCPRPPRVAAVRRYVRDTEQGYSAVNTSQ